jgi:hypothetical protein
VKYENAVEHKVPGRHSSDNTVPRLTEHFISKIPPTAKKSRPQRRYQKRGRKDTVYWCDACGVGTASSVSETTTPS